MLKYFAGRDEQGVLTMPRQRFLAQGGRVPYLELANDPQIQELLVRQMVGEPVVQRELNAMVKQRQGIKTSWYPEWESYFMTQVHEALLKNQSVQAAVTASAREARRLKQSY